MLRLEYTLHEHGWADASIGNGETVIEFEVSYLSDALGDLARAARGILRGLPSAAVGFQQEPGSTASLSPATPAASRPPSSGFTTTSRAQTSAGRCS